RRAPRRAADRRRSARAAARGRDRLPDRGGAESRRRLADREARDRRGVLPPELPLFDLEGRAAAQGVGARGVPAQLTRRALRVLCHRDDLAAACGRRAGALRGRLLGPGVEPSRATLYRARAPRPFVDPRVRQRRLARRGHDAAGLGRQIAEPPSAWIERIHATELAPILDLHYRYRFDPAGLSPTERAELRAQADAWLREQNTTETTVTGGRRAG